MARLNVLVVDDDLDAAFDLAELVGRNGHDAQIACDGRSAIRNLCDADFQLVLLDIGLPDMDGYEVVRRLALLGQCRLTIVALSGEKAAPDEVAGHVVDHNAIGNKADGSLTCVRRLTAIWLDWADY